MKILLCYITIKNLQKIITSWTCMEVCKTLASCVMKLTPHRFYVIDKNWQKIMARAHDNPNVVTCCVGDDMLKQLLPYLQDQLEVCQKSLSG